MNWTTIKHIYRRILISNDKIEYLGKDKHRLTVLYPNGNKHWQKEYKDGQSHGKDVYWHENGNKYWEYEYQNGKRIK